MPLKLVSLLLAEQAKIEGHSVFGGTDAVQCLPVFDAEIKMAETDTEENTLPAYSAPCFEKSRFLPDTAAFQASHFHFGGA